jgi:hypothetical protein
MLKSDNAAVRAAALRALGPLGEAGDVPVLVKTLSAAAGSEKNLEKTAAAASLARLGGPAVNGAIVAEMKTAKPAVRAGLLATLATRRAIDCIPSMLEAARDADPAVRLAALAALGQLAKPEHLPPLVAMLLESSERPQRDATERAILQVTGRIPDAAKRADPLLAVYAGLGDEKKLALFPTLGRVGGPEVRRLVEASIVAKTAAERDAGMRALCNWPDGSVGPRLLELAKTAEEPRYRAMALAALIRVAPLPDKRPAAEKLQMLQAAMGLASRDEDRKLILKRAEAVRTMDTLRWVASYLENPTLAQQACATLVELAHHRDLREPNKAEFDRLLDRVIAMSKDAVVVERAKRYKAGQTYKKSQ